MSSSRALVDLAAAEARIDERPEPDARQQSGLARGDVTEQVGDDALRQVVGLDLVGDRERLQLGHEPPVAADHASDEPLVAEVVEAAILAVALSGGVDERQAARRALAVRILAGGFDVAFLERDGDVFREADADEAAGGDRVPIANQRDGLTRADDLAVLEGVQRSEELSLVGGRHGSCREPLPAVVIQDRVAGHCGFPLIDDVVDSCLR